MPAPKPLPGFADAWREFYPGSPPIAHLLRVAERERWVRFHSLPESKRYAETAQETQIVLQRANRLATRVLGNGSSCWLVQANPHFQDWTEYEPHPSIGALGLSLAFEHASREDETTYRIYAGRVSWSPGAFDDLIRLRADDALPLPTMWVNASTGDAFAPYDGGTDLFVRSQAEVSRLKSEFPDWLSAHPAGL